MVCSSTIPSTSHGPSPPLSSIWDPRISSLTSRGGGLSDLSLLSITCCRSKRSDTQIFNVWSAPVGGIEKKTGVKGSFDRASRDARSSSFSYFLVFWFFFLLFCSFFLAWDGHFRGDLTFTRSNTGIVRGRLVGARLRSSLLKQYTRTPPSLRAN